MSRPSGDSAEQCKLDHKDLERQENIESKADMDEIEERLCNLIHVELGRDDRKKLTVLLVQVCIRLELKWHTVREWRQDFFRNPDSFSEYRRGNYVYYPGP